MKYTLKVIADIHCEIYIDRKFYKAVPKDSITSLLLEEGAYCIRFVSTINPQIMREEVVLLKWHECIYTKLIEEIELHPEWHRDCDIDRNRMNIITGKVMQKTQYDFYKMCGEHHYIVSNRRKYGLRDRNYNLIIPLNYDSIEPISESLLAVKKYELWGIINTSGESVTDIIYEHIGVLSNDLIRVKVDDKWGYINEQGNIVIAPIYKTASDFDGKHAIVSEDELEWSVINAHNQIILKLKCDNLTINNWYQFEISGKLGLIDNAYRILIPCKYDSIKYKGGFIVATKTNAIDYFTEDGELINIDFDNITFSKNSNSSITQTGNKYGYWCCGERILDDEYDQIAEFGYALKALKENKWMVMEPGSCKEPEYYDEVCPFDKKAKIAKVRVKDKWGVIDEFGEEIIEPKYDYIGEFNNNIAPARKNGCIGFIYIQGYFHHFESIYNNENPEITEISKIKDNIAYVKYGGKWGFTKIILPDNFNYDFCNYKHYNIECEEIGEFSEGLVKVKVNNLWGYADLNGAIVIPCQFENAEDFHEGRANVQIKHRGGFINKLGDIVIPLEYITFEAFDEYPPIIDYQYFQNGVVTVRRKDGKRILLDKYGHIVK